MTTTATSQFPYLVVDHHGALLGEFPEFVEAKDWANAKGLIICSQDTDGTLSLIGDDPLIAKVLGETHCLASFRHALRNVISLWERDQYRRFEYRAYSGGRAPCPGWATYKAHCKSARRTLMRWVHWIHQRNRQTYVAVMTGRL